MKPVFLKVDTEKCLLTEWWSGQDLGGSEELRELFKFGGIYINGDRVKVDQPLESLDLKSGDVLRIYRQTKRFPIEKVCKSNILWDDHYITAIDKPAKVPSLPVASNAIENCKYFLENTIGKKHYPLHRIDEATSGILLFAKDFRWVREFHKDAKVGGIVRTYQALTDYPVTLGIHVHYLKKGEGKMLCFNKKVEGAKRAILNIEDCQPHNPFEDDCKYLSTIRLVTGRTHQIRCQLAHMGSPIIGDPIYGEEGDSEKKLHLIAHKLIWKKYQFTSKFNAASW